MARWVRMVCVLVIVTSLAVSAAGQAAPGAKGPAAGGTPATPATPAKAAPGKAAEPAVPLTAVELEAKLKETAAGGKFTDALPGLFLQYADLKAREKLVPAAVSEEFWTWLTGNKVLHKAVLVNLHPKYDGAAVKCLAELRDKFPAEVDKMPHLALAFALDYAAAGKRPIVAGWFRKHKDPAAVPTMLDSFEYYATNAKRMIYPPDKVPWPLLVFVADNDLPLAERTWAMIRYGKAAPEAFGKIYYEVPYDMEGLTKAADQSGLKVNGVPYTLENILAQGGVCADRAYYTSRILKSLGVPAVYDSGEGARGGHAWVAWASVSKGQFGLADSGRFDYDQYFTGGAWNPLTRRAILDREVELMAAGMSKSYDGYMDTLIAGHVFRMCVGSESAAKATGLLKDVIARRNHYSADTWRLLSAAVADGTLPPKDGETLYGLMAAPFAQYPDLTFSFLQDILKPRLASTEKVAETEVKGNVILLDKAFALYEKAGRPDLSVALRMLQGQYLEATGYKDKAMQLYMTASQQYVKAHFGFLPLFERSLVLLAGPENQKLRLKYLDYMAANVPEYQGGANSPTREVNPAYVAVVKACVAALRETGDEKKAAEWEAKLPKTTKKG